jgi:hypothetical protein
VQVTDPEAPVFVRYYNDRNYDAQFAGGVTTDNVVEMGLLGPESLKYIPASNSPNGKSLLLSSGEVSGSMAVFEITMPNGRGACLSPNCS